MLVYYIFLQNEARNIITPNTANEVGRHVQYMWEVTRSAGTDANCLFIFKYTPATCGATGNRRHKQIFQ